MYHDKWSTLLFVAWDWNKCMCFHARILEIVPGYGVDHWHRHLASCRRTHRQRSLLHTSTQAKRTAHEFKWSIGAPSWGPLGWLRPVALPSHTPPDNDAKSSGNPTRCADPSTADRKIIGCRHSRYKKTETNPRTKPDLVPRSDCP